MGKVKKTVENAVSDVGHAISNVGKSVSKGVKSATKSVGKIGSKAFKFGKGLVKNVVQSPISAVKDLAKGDVVGALTNLGNVATGGTMDLTGGGKGVVNVDTKKTLAKVMGADMGASGVGSVSIPETYKTGKSGLIQLRKGRGTPGGGSYSETAKNPLGGTAGKTGK